MKREEEGSLANRIKADLMRKLKKKKKETQRVLIYCDARPE